MGGASSFIAMLSIAGFLTATWIATKVSKLAGVSSIVLEITTGLVLGPQILGLMSPEYSICEHSRHIECEPPPDFAERIANFKPLGETFGRIANTDLCPYEDYHHGDHGGHIPGGHGADATHGVSHRRLSGGNYATYEECLIKSCEAEISHHCQLTPDVFTLIGHAGVAMMIFESGMHFDFEKAKVVGLPACAVAVLGTILPLITGTLLVVIYGRPFFPDGVSAGTALAPTSVGIALRLLGEARVLDQNFGQAIITAAFVDDILSLVLFNVLFSLGGDFNVFDTVVKPIIGIIFMLLAMAAAVHVMPKAIDEGVMKMVPERRAEGKVSCLLRFKLTKDEMLFVLQIALLVVYGTITHFLGTHLWGCFIAGMSFACLNPPHHAHHVWVKQTKRVTTWMIRIFFSCTVAFSIPVDKLLSLNAFWKGMIMGWGPCIMTKVCCAPFMGPAKWVIGWAMVGRAEFAYLIAQMAAAANMMDQETFSICIWALLCATIFAPFIFRILLNRYVASQGLLEGKGEGESYGEHIEEKLEFGDTSVDDKERLRDLEGIDVKGAMQQTKEKGYYDAPPLSATIGNADQDLQAGNGVARRKGAAAPDGALPGSGFLCCLFFKKILVQ